jgi:hypothetical protein
MGSPETESGHQPIETLHKRNIGRRIAIATKEVTHEQWRAFFQANPDTSWESNQEQLTAYIGTDDSPMNRMTWYEAAWYCNWLSEREGIQEVQWCYEKNDKEEYGPGMKAKENFWEFTGYRLPTEAEWEYACRAGASTSRYYGLTEALLPRYAWYQANGENHTHPVASLKPNDFGLFDMQGNVYGWCYDAYVSSYPTSKEEAASDTPSAKNVEDANRRVQRGGAFNTQPPSSLVRSANRSSTRPDNRFDTTGFRPARTYHLSP